MTTKQLRELLAKARIGRWSFTDHSESMALIDEQDFLFAIGMTEADAELVCEAVDALPALLDVVEAAERLEAARVEFGNPTTACKAIELVQNEMNVFRGLAAALARFKALP